ncbi:hypothetical protein KCP75_09460 [Salmonella enterica subsp. enterica]|nr:hypothetical protein KCP75_09460 [Salmonella enterica subsp. enterica]
MKKNSPLWARITRDIPPAGQGIRKNGGQPTFASGSGSPIPINNRSRRAVRRRMKSVT